jgi:hypothetical protein
MSSILFTRTMCQSLVVIRHSVRTKAARQDSTRRARSFSYFDVKASVWRANPGVYNLMLGESSKDIQLQGTLQLTNADCPDRRLMMKFAKA